ncbi:hypothetical protein [Nocardioides sp. W7]|uniref:DUF7144 family membrane protein n=1 Tax=Nocardioides sp. W7 TaxID=2931390 RepID=UPI001FD04080|nr:hypothetical protein [Nocardioides sp. W7]
MPGPDDDVPDRVARALLADLSVALGGVLLILASVLDLVQGASAVNHDQMYAQGVEFLYRFDTTVWGWIHIAIGVIGIVVALGVMLRKSWGPVAGLIVAGLSILTNFSFLPLYPVWGVIIIAFNTIVIWALCVQLKAYR